VGRQRRRVSRRNCPTGQGGSRGRTTTRARAYMSEAVIRLLLLGGGGGRVSRSLAASVLLGAAWWISRDAFGFLDRAEVDFDSRRHYLPVVLFGILLDGLKDDLTAKSRSSRRSFRPDRPRWRPRRQ